ncbi:MAG: BACON domain-containing protein [Myxococcales bacterium]|jgi:hypothetical protein
MTRAARNPRPESARPPLRALAFCLAALALAACSEDPIGPGRLEVVVGGLPQGVPASIFVEGPAHYRTTVTETQTLEPLEAGDYKLTVMMVKAADGQVFHPVEPSLSAKVELGKLTTVQALYAAEVPPDLGFLPTRVEMAALVGDAAQAELQIRNLTGGAIEYSASAGASWLKIESGASGSIGPGESVRVEIAGTCEEEGTRESSLQVATATGSKPYQVPVTQFCTREPQPEIAEVTPRPLVLTASVGTVATGRLSIPNVGTGTLSYNARSEIDWLIVRAPVSGNVLPGRKATLEVTGRCDSAGSFSGQVIIETNDADEPSVEVPIKLECSDEPVPDVSEPAPNPLVLDTNDGESVEGTFTFTNEGRAPLAFTVTEQLGWLQVVSGEAGTLAAGERATVRLSATCESAGVRSGTVTVVSDDPDEAEKPVAIELTCIPVAPSIVSFEPSAAAIDLGSSTTLSWEVTGSAPMTLTVSPRSIDVSGQQSLEVTPTTMTEYTLTAKNAAGQVSAKTTIEVRIPDIGAPAPSALSLAAYTGESATAQVSFDNQGDGPLSFTVSGAGWLSATPGSGTVAAGASVTLTVVATCGSSPATRHADLTIASNDPDEPAVAVPVSLECTYAPAPDIGTPTPTSISMTAIIGQTASATLSFENVGNLPLDYTVSAGAAWLTVQPPTSGSLAPTASATLGVTGACGSTVTTLSTTLSIATNDPDEATVSVPVSLTCRPVPVPDIGAPYPSSIQVGAAPGDSTTAQVHFPNDGEADLTFQVSPGAAWMAAAPISGTVEPAGWQAIDLTLTCPTSGGVHNAQVTIQSNDPDEPQISVPVQLDCTATLDLRFERAYLAQATQNPEGTVSLLAGLPAVARAFVVANESGTSNVTVRVHALRNGTSLGSQDLTGPWNVPLSVPDDAGSNSYNGMLPADWIEPGLEVYFEIDPGQQHHETNERNNRFPATGMLAVDVKTVPDWPVTLVPIVYNGRTGDVNGGNAHAWLEQARRYEPVVGYSVEVHAPVAYNGMLASNGAGWDTLLYQVDSLRTAEGSSRHYVAVVSPGYSGGVAGLGFVGRPAAVVWDGANRADSLAHEVGHNWGREHAPCGVLDADPGYPSGPEYSGGSIGVWGWDRLSNSYKSPAGHKDFMSYCDPVWTSDYTYMGILNYRLTRPYSTERAAPEPVLLVRGVIGESGARLEPAFHLVAPPSPPEKGEWRVEGLDANGGLLFAQGFAAARVAHLDESHFAFSVPLGDRLASVLSELIVRDADGRVVVARRVSGTISEAEPEVEEIAVGLRVRWNHGEVPGILARDASTGQVIAISDGPQVVIGVPARSVELLLSDGVRTRRRFIHR